MKTFMTIPDISTPDANFEDIFARCRDATMTSRERLLALYHAVRHVEAQKLPGAFVECGVWRGGSVMAMALTLLKLGVTNRDIWLYDTFEGMSAPDENDLDIEGRLASDLLSKEAKSEQSTLWAMASMDAVMANLAATGYPMERFHLVKGKVEDTLEDNLPGPISLLRLDTDWYESTRRELKCLYPALCGGGVLILDDYGHWKGARKAVDDYLLALDAPPALDVIDYTGRITVKPLPSPRAAKEAAPLSIAVVNTYDNYGGAARAAHRLFKVLRRSGELAHMVVREKSIIEDENIVQIHAPTSGPLQAHWKQVRELIEKEASVYPKLSSRVAQTAFSTDRSALGPSLCQSLGLSKTDIVNLHWVADFLDYENLFAQSDAEVPVVWTLHDMNVFTGGCHYPGKCLGYRSRCGNCPTLFSNDPDDLSARTLQRKHDIFSGSKRPLYFVTPSKWLAGELKSSRLFPHADVTIIPNSLDLESFRPLGREHARQELGLTENATIILFVSQNALDWRKGLDLLDTALIRLGSRQDITLLTAGYDFPQIYAKVQHAHAGQITNDDAMCRLYSAADLVIVPSREDNLPNTIMEAMACATPVAAFDVGGIPDMISHGETGFLVPALDTDALGATIASALSDRNRLAIMGQIGRIWAEQEYAPQVQADRYVQLFRRILQTPSPVAKP